MHLYCWVLCNEALKQIALVQAAATVTAKSTLGKPWRSLMCTDSSRFGLECSQGAGERADFACVMYMYDVYVCKLC